MNAHDCDKLPQDMSRILVSVHNDRRLFLCGPLFELWLVGEELNLIEVEAAVQYAIQLDGVNNVRVNGWLQVNLGLFVTISNKDKQCLVFDV